MSGVVGRACYDELKLIHEVVMALKEARVKDKNSLAIDFSERVGVPIDRRYLYDFFDAMNARVKGEGSHFILKTDGDRVAARLTFVFCDRARDVVLRRDTSSIEDGMMHMFAGLEEAGGYA
ncbi:hypothetical protein [Stenotrophomonas maltophilia]|uniref:hypothetical protein n=1 Tax=Stenotrophomonas maltophilia TaxID=40324 RepID=UPI0011B8230A|nr:hypothetical protein [Stenotrophomonas maltophilia]